MATFIFLHGSFHAAWNWHKVSLLAVRGQRPVASDLPGHGRDPAPREEVTLKSCVASVLEDTPCGRVFSRASGHSPFRSQPAALADVLVTSAATFDEWPRVRHLSPTPAEASS